MSSAVYASSGTALQTLGLALMVGGMLAIGAFCAPVIFKQFPRHEAGAALTIVFRRYDMLLLIALGLVLAGEVGRYLSGVFVSLHWSNLLRYGLIVLLSGLMIYSTQFVNKEIERMQHAGIAPNATPEGIAFSKTHQLSEKIYKAEMLLATLLLLLTPFVPRDQ